jgi:hypothetical protein
VSSLAEKIVALHTAFALADLPHAFGGALALAFHVGEPRGTRDVDVNVFVGGDRATEVFGALPDAVAHDERDRDEVATRGQVRVFWDETPVDLFLSTHPFHAEAQAHIVDVPFEGTTIPVLDATDLTVFKAFFDRTRDWADIEAMLEADTVDAPRALGWLVDMLGPGDPRVARLADLRRHPSGADEPRFAPPVQPD